MREQELRSKLLALLAGPCNPATLAQADRIVAALGRTERSAAPVSVETRTYNARVELRTVGKDKKIGGYAARFNIPSNPIPSRNGKFQEVLRPGAFDIALENSDTVCLVQHDDNKILGRTSARTLRLKTDHLGLQFECDLPDTSYARDLYESVKRGDLNECSFAFGQPDDEWDYSNSDMPVRYIRSIGVLRDVSVVAQPAYPNTQVGVRSDIDLVEVRSRFDKRTDWRAHRGWRDACAEYGVNPDTASGWDLGAAVNRHEQQTVARQRQMIDFLLN